MFYNLTTMYIYIYTLAILPIFDISVGVYSARLLMMDRETVAFYSKNKFEK